MRHEPSFCSLVSAELSSILYDATTAKLRAMRMAGSFVQMPRSACNRSPWVLQTCECRYSSRISTAAAMVVVHLPRLSPTADCVMLLVRTILFEMR